MQTFAGTLASVEQAAFRLLPASCIACIAANLSMSRYALMCLSVTYVTMNRWLAA